MKLWPAARKCLDIMKHIDRRSQEEYANFCIISWFALRLPQLSSDLNLELSASEQQKLTEVAHSLAERQTLSSERIRLHQKTENLAEWELAVLHEQVGFLRLRLHDLIDASSIAALQTAQDQIQEELIRRNNLG